MFLLPSKVKYITSLSPASQESETLIVAKLSHRVRLGSEKYMPLGGKMTTKTHRPLVWGWREMISSQGHEHPECSVNLGLGRLYGEGGIGAPSPFYLEPRDRSLQAPL